MGSQCVVVDLTVDRWRWKRCSDINWLSQPVKGRRERGM
jgi:hypothetical protein